LPRYTGIAVHERALFDYLTPELRPAFAGDSLIKITWTFEGKAVMTPRALGFEGDCRDLPEHLKHINAALVIDGAFMRA